MDWTTIVVAVIAAGPVYLGLRKTNRKIDDSHKILQGNGKGNVMVMLEALIEGQARHEVDDTIRFAHIEEGLRRARTLPVIPSRRK